MFTTYDKKKPFLVNYLLALLSIIENIQLEKQGLYTSLAYLIRM